MIGLTVVSRAIMSPSHPLALPIGGPVFQWHAEKSGSRFHQAPVVHFAVNLNLKTPSQYLFR